MGVLWLFAKPALVESISAAVADDFDDQIEEHAEPIQGAFRVILLSDINRLKRNIAKLEFKEDHKPDLWTAGDADRLADYLIELAAFQEAYSEL